MDLYRIIDDLVQERDRLARIIQSLEGMAPATPGSAPDRPPGKRRGRKFMDMTARQEVSERMKLYWAARRNGKQKESHDPAIAGGRGNPDTARGDFAVAVHPGPNF